MTVTDATGTAYQLLAGTLPADGRPHLLTAPLGGTQVSYPLRLTQLTLNYTLPAKKGEPLTLTLSGARLNGWTHVATSPELTTLLGTAATLGPSGQPRGRHLADRAGRGDPHLYDSGFGQAATDGSTLPGPPQPVNGRVTWRSTGSPPPWSLPSPPRRSSTPPTPAASALPCLPRSTACRSPVKIVAETTTFPTVTGPALIGDLATIQSFLASRIVAPLSVNQWWLAPHPDIGCRRRWPGCCRRVPGVTSQELGLAAAHDRRPALGGPAAGAARHGLAAALLAVTGFWVSIAANVRQRRAENALLAALRVAQRSAAAQLLIEEVAAQRPGGRAWPSAWHDRRPAPGARGHAHHDRADAGPAPVTLFDLPQTVPLALFVAVAPALAAALVVIHAAGPRGGTARPQRRP